MKKTAIIFLTVLLSVLLCSCGQVSMMINSFLNSGKYIDWGTFSAEPSELGSQYKNFFGRLDFNQKKGYNNILKAVYESEEEFPERIEVPMMSADELSSVYEAVLYDNPDIMCYGKDGSIITEGEHCFFEPDYTMGVTEFRQKKAAMEDAADTILSHCADKTDPFETELYIHDFIIKNCEYKISGVESGMVYTCLSKGFSSCEGYSKTTKYLLEKAGIESYNVIGNSFNADGEQEYHMWNLVNINGNYYYVDTTWDDPNLPSGEVSHIYFNITQQELEKDHSKFICYYNCDSMYENYFVKKGSYFESYNQDEFEKMTKVLAEETSGGKKYMEIRFGSKDVYDEALKDLTVKGKAYTMVKNANKFYGTNINHENISYTPLETFLTVRIMFR